ncbi:MAG: prenyltransferase [bacterium]|nr:prenyltransferase [bacterium]
MQSPLSSRNFASEQKGIPLSFSKFAIAEAKVWSYFLDKVGGFENNRILGIIRVVSLPITLFSAIIGALLSAVFDSFDPLLFLVNTLGLLLAHSASNVINDYWDYKKGIDSEGYFRNIYGIHPVYALGEKKALALGLLLSFLAFLSGLYLFLIRGVWVLVLAILGFIFLFSYSGPPFRFKYIGLGELVVFLVWGPIMICGTFFVITGEFDWMVLLASVPYGITASLVLFGKHLDKLEQDKQKRAYTLPVILGEDKTKKLCKILIFVPYIVALTLAFLSQKYGFLMALISFPRALSLFGGLDIPKPKDVSETPDLYPKKFWPMWYVGATFIFNVDFSISYIIALIVSLFV